MPSPEPRTTWNTFVHDFEKNNNSPILSHIFKKSTLKTLSDGAAVLSCKNQGMHLFLESRKKGIESLFSSWLGHNVRFTFEARENSGKKKPPKEIPLLKFKQDKDQALQRSGLQTHLTFENFAVSSSNNIAHTAAVATANNPGKTYNPLFIYGGVGHGKTHLMQAVGHKILEKDPDKRLLYCSSEEFTNDLIEQIRAKNTASLRRKYRNLDALLIDDVQFIAGKNYVQEEFYHTFNTIIRKHGQIVLTSDKPPKEINRLEDRLRSRFSGGLSIDIQKPDFELRSAIVLIKARERNIDLDIEAAKLIAEKVTDTRALEGKLLEIYARTLRQNTPITEEIVSEELDSQEEQKIKKIEPASVLKYVSSFYDVRPSMIRGKTRKTDIVLPRQITMFIMRNKLKLKYEEIAFILKRKDHTTIMHGVEKITKLCLKNSSVKEDIDKITDSL